MNRLHKGLDLESIQTNNITGQNKDYVFVEYFFDGVKQKRLKEDLKYQICLGVLLSFIRLMRDLFFAS